MLNVKEQLAKSEDWLLIRYIIIIIIIPTTRHLPPRHRAAAAAAVVALYSRCREYQKPADEISKDRQIIYYVEHVYERKSLRKRKEKKNEFPVRSFGTPNNN